MIDGIWRAPQGPDGPLTPIGPTDTVRLVINDFMFTGGDGYTALQGGADVLEPGDDLLDVTIEYIAAHSPVAPVVQGSTGESDPGLRTHAEAAEVALEGLLVELLADEDRPDVARLGLLFFTPLHLTIFIEPFILSPLTTGSILFPGQNSA